MGRSQATAKDAARELRGLKVLLADEDEGALRITAATVRELGHEVAEMAIGIQEAAETIARDDPDVSIVVVYEEHSYALEMISEIVEYARGPVIAVMDDGSPEFIDEAASAGSTPTPATRRPRRSSRRSRWPCAATKSAAGSPSRSSGSSRRSSAAR